MTNNRKYQRYSFDSEIVFEAQGTRQSARAINISQGGILIKTESNLAYGSKVTLHLTLPKLPEVCKIPCIVRWNGEEKRAGLQFEQLRAKEVWGLNRLIHGLKVVEPSSPS